MNYKLFRREFLKLIGSAPLLAPLAAAFPGCIPAPAGPPRTVALVKHNDDASALRQAVELAGGLDFLAPGDSVLLKIALNSCNSFPATTSPETITHLIGLLKEKGAGDIYVGDKSPTWQDTRACLKETGIADAVDAAGAELAVFEDDDMVPVQPADARFWPKGFSMPGIFNTVNHIIVLPTLRTHALADFTMGIKIMVGAIPQKDRFRMHSSAAFLQAIAEIMLCTDKLRLSVLDARQGFNRDGPDDGNLITPNIMIASHDIVAADIVGVALLQTTDTTPKLKKTSVWHHPTIRHGIRVKSPGLGTSTLNIAAEGTDIIEEIQNKLI
ncbi:MAG: DUF362 domain-containing protein [Deltaproteobacteria bacterium]|nr:DUF362 domain-containing protein [Deltaproteobacteria bacterium]